MMELIDTEFKRILSDTPYKLVISNPKEKGQRYKKIEIALKGDYYQANQYTDKQVFHENIPNEDIEKSLISWMEDYSQLNAWGDTMEYELKISKKGKIFLNSKKTTIQKKISHDHNRKKNYILQEGTIIPPLVDMGIFTKSGDVVKSMYDKYKQINRFVEIIDDAIKGKNLASLTVIDFGCGKSYLTFVLYYYFTEIKKVSAKIIGLDLKEEVIKNCNLAANKYGYKGLTFELGDINGYKCDFPVDMVITLHACDTATDYALYNAIQWEADMIFTVPCCQHELNSQITSDYFSILTKYGILKERFSALATDAIRGNILESCGYSTQLLEFIDFSHTPKNILIRAVKNPKMSESKKNQALAEVQKLIDEFHFTPTLCGLLHVKQQK